MRTLSLEMLFEVLADDMAGKGQSKHSNPDYDSRALIFTAELEFVELASSRLQPWK